MNVKFSRVGGLTAARRMRDTAVPLGMYVGLEDTRAGDVTTTSFFNDSTNEQVAGYSRDPTKGLRRLQRAPFEVRLVPQRACCRESGDCAGAHTIAFVEGRVRPTGPCAVRAGKQESQRPAAGAVGRAMLER